ncbi:GNAT family N-acetyltransferase [Virgibacillus salarius]
MVTVITSFHGIKEELEESEVLEILKESVYMPTQEKLAARVRQYINEPTILAFGYRDDRHMVGVIIVSYDEDTCHAVIKDIAVRANLQKSGIGSTMIAYMMEELKPSIITVETDDDALGFYLKNGFAIVNQQQKFANITRYNCHYDVRS